VKVWNWEERERYPGVCVEGLGEVMKAEVVGRVQWRALDWCALVVVTVLAGVVGAVGVWWAWKRVSGLFLFCFLFSFFPNFASPFSVWAFL